MRSLRRPIPAVVLVAAALALPAVAQAKLPSFADGSWAANVGIGGVKLGQTHAQAKSAWGPGGTCNDYYCQYQDPRRASLGYATVSFEDGKRGRVSNMIISTGSDPRTGRPVFRTPLANVEGPNGIKLGSSFRAVKAAYPKARAPRGSTDYLSLTDRHRNTTLLFFSARRLSRIVIQDSRARG